MVQYSSLEKIMDVKEHFKNVASSRNLIRVISILFVITSIAMFSCEEKEKEEEEEEIIVSFDGSGTSTDPYLIGTAEQLAEFAELVNASAIDNAYNDKFYRLTADIDLSSYGSSWNNEKGWIPIGAYNPFLGNFDGNNRKVNGLYINDGSIIAGLFGAIYGTVRNLGVSGTVIGGNEVGGIVGLIEDGGSIANCYAAVIVSGQNMVGGVIGRIVMGNMSNCYATGTVSGSLAVGGVAGLVAGSSLTNCYATGAVSSAYAGNNVGGVVGEINGGSVARSVALNPSITLTSFAVTEVGRVAGANFGTLNNNVAWYGMEALGGIVFNIGSVNNKDGADITTTQAKTQTTYTGIGWSFGNNDNNPWKMGVGEYALPVFYWQTTAPAAMPDHLRE